jgi:hypothetical protein
VNSLAISPPLLVLFGFGSSFWWLQDVSLFLFFPTTTSLNHIFSAQS